jgi:hypothetical protein
VGQCDKGSIAMHFIKSESTGCLRDLCGEEYHDLHDPKADLA